MECASWELPTWQMCSAKSLGNNTLSCNVGSMCFPPECPGIARTGIHTILESLLNSTSSLQETQRCSNAEDVKSERNIVAKSWNLSTPSSSRSTVSSCRNQSDHQLRYFQTTFVQSRLSISAHDRAPESSQKMTSNLVSVSALPSQRVSPHSLQYLRCESLPTSPLRIGISRSRSSPMNESHRQMESWSWSRPRNGLVDKCWDDLLLRRNVSSRHEPFSLSSSVSQSIAKYGPFSTAFARPALEQFGQFKMNWKICRNGLICCRQFGWHYHGLRVVRCHGSPCTLWTFGDFLGYLFTHIRHCSVDTELIDGNDCAPL